MTEIVHDWVPAGCIGKMDSYGYGSRATFRRWPTLPGSPVHVVCDTTGGRRFPVIPDTRVVRDDTGDPGGWSIYAWDQTPYPEPNGRPGRVAIGDDGVTYTPERRDGRDVIVERRPSTAKE